MGLRSSQGSLYFRRNVSYDTLKDTLVTDFVPAGARMDGVGLRASFPEIATTRIEPPALHLRILVLLSPFHETLTVFLKVTSGYRLK